MFDVTILKLMGGSPDFLTDHDESEVTSDNMGRTIYIEHKAK